jgi:hypothetical protein
MHVDSIRHAIDVLVYASVAMGLVLLPQLYVLAPTWLFYSVLAGWLVYFLVAVAVATGRKIAYRAVFVLSLLTLLVSVPQPEHYSFAEEGMLLATFTFAVGSALQIALIVLIPIYLIKKRQTIT